MTLDETLVRTARERLNAIYRAERDVVIARESSRESIRELHRAGGSLREIAAALSMSHQRVHQLLAGPVSPALFACSFCGADQRARQVVMGPGQVGICGPCTDSAIGLLQRRTTAPADSSRDPSMRVTTVGRPCSFCGKSSPGQTAATVVAATRIAICPECLALAAQILGKEQAPSN